MFGKFSEEAQKILVLSKKEMTELKHQNIGSEHLLLAVLKNSIEISQKLKKYKVTYKRFKEEIINTIGIGENENNLFIYSPLLKRIL